MNALWWWIDRWRKSTAFTGMTLEEQGAYRNLLDEAALRGGPIPDNEDLLARACGDARRWKRVRAAVMARFTLSPDGWRNETMDAVIAESKRRADKQRRYRNGSGNAPGNAGGNESGNSVRPHLDPDPEMKRETSYQRSEEGLGETKSLPERAGEFCEWYADEHSAILGVGYIGNPQKDYQKALEMCRVFGDAELRDAALVWFGQKDTFATDGTRTITKFGSRASDLVKRARKVTA